MADADDRRPLRAVGPGAAGFFSLILAASIPVLPLIGVLFGLLASLPLVHLVASGRPSLLGWGWVAVALVGTALVFQQPWLVAAAFGYLVVAALPAVCVEAWQRRSWSAGRWHALGAFVAVGLACGFLLAWFSPQHPGDGVAAVLLSEAGGAERLTAALVGAGEGTSDLVASSLRLAGNLAPALLAIFVQASLLWLRPRLPMLGFAKGSEPFSAFNSEEWLPVPFAIGGLGWVFADGIAQWVSLNLFVTVLALYFFHGLAIIHYYLGTRLASNRWVRLLLILLAIQLPIAASLATLGLVDSFYSLRRGSQLSGGDEA